MMKRKLLFSALLVTAGLLNASAQTDVTSTYLTNADFSQTTPIATNLKGYGKDGTPYGFQAVDGWTSVVLSGDNSNASYPNSGMGGAVFEYGSSYQMQGNNKTAPSVDPNGGAGNCLGFFGVWGCGGYYYQEVTLPVGHYTITVPIYNQSGTNGSESYTGFYVDNNTKYTVAVNTTVGQWVSKTVDFDLSEETTGRICVGYKSNGSGSGANPMIFIDGVKIEYTDPLQAAKDALQAEIDKAKLCDAKEGLASAISTAEGVLASATTESELTEALATLQAADKDAVLRYENGLADATYAAPVVTSFVVNGTFDSGISGWSRTGTYQNNKTANNQSGAFTGNFYENWNGSAMANKMYQTISNIPNGTYRLDIAAFVNTLADPNESQYVFANDDKVYLTTGTPTAYEVYTVVTDNQVEIGLEQTTATANWMGIDNVSLRYYGAGDVINDAKNASHKLAWEEAKAAAEAALASDDYANVTGSEKVALAAEIAKAEPSTADDYDAAAAALTTATSTFVAAKTNYDIFVAYNATLEYADAGKKPEITSESTAASVITALRAYYESNAAAESVAVAKDFTSYITNANNPTNNDGWTWTGNKNNPASNEPWTDADGTNTHSYFDGGYWSANSWTTTMSQTITVPAGKYLLTAKGRAATNTTLTMSVGEASVELPHASSTGNVFDRGWGDASLEFTVGEDDATATILVTASSSTIHEWFSISDFRLVQLEETVVPMADAGDYTDLATAISTAEAYKLGFEKGEYAPYNNVEALKALADAKAIDPAAEGGNRKKVVQNATTALTSATWTANDKEVNAIYNGDFALSTPNETSGDVDVPGWTKVDGMRLIVGDTETNPGLEYTNEHKALFSWGGTTITYGETTGYTLPLKANTVYALTCKISGWRDGDLPSWAGLAVENAEVVVPTITGVGRINQAEGDPFKTFTFKFKTSEAGDYVIGLSVNKHFTVTDLSLLKVEETEIAGTTIYAANGYGTFMSAIAREIPEGLEAYTVTGVDENKVLVMSDALESIPANTPVILENTTDADVVIPNTNGQSLAVENTYTVGLLTGTYEEIKNAPEGKYVLQNHGGKVGFYQVDYAELEEQGKDIPKVPANRAYLTYENPTAKARAFFFDGGDATAIEAVSAIAAGEIEAIYTTGGVQVQSLQKGMNIVVLKNGKTQKVFVK